jgi:iron complex outermembrane receptor protein
VTDQLALGLSVVYNDARFDEFKNGGGTGVDFDGNVLPFAPKWRARLSVDHRAALGTGGSVVASVSAIYNGSLYTTPNTLPVNFVDSYTLLDAQLGYESDRGGWGVYLWGTNLTDETYSINTNLNFLNIARSTYGWPRQYGVRFSFDYRDKDSR